MKVGLALGGGGARALAHIGVLKALEEFKVEIDFIAGTSMGALVGGLYALRPDAAYVEKIIREYLIKYKKDISSLKMYAARSSVDEKKLFLEKSFSFAKDLYLWNLRIVKPYLISPKPFFKMFKELFKYHKFSDCRIPFSCVAVDLLKGEAVTLCDNYLFRNIAASCALPGFFPPLKTKDKVLVDGGVLMPLPVATLKNCADFIIGVPVHESFSPYNMKNALDIMFTADKVRYKKIIEYSQQGVDFFISPPVSSYAWSDFDYVEEIIQKGYKEAYSRKKELLKAASGRRISSFLGVRKIIGRIANRLHFGAVV